MNPKANRKTADKRKRFFFITILILLRINIQFSTLHTMRFFCLIIILFAFFAPIKPHATEQIPDYLIHNDKKYPLELEEVYEFEVGILQHYMEKTNKWKWRDYFSLQPYLEKVNKWLLQFYTPASGDWSCSALTRGYYATFEVVNNKLVLKDISDCDGNLFFFKLKGSIFKMDWFTDSLVIGEGDSFYGFHEYYSVFHFEKEMLIKQERISYKEYTSHIPKEFLYSYWFRDLGAFEHYLETEKEDKSEFLAELKTKYEEKFVQPISDFELAIQRISFRNIYSVEARNKNDTTEFISKYYTINITRTLYGAHAKYNEEEEIQFNGKVYDVRNEQPKSVNVKLSMEEWLDFIRALHTCCFDKWEKNPVPHHYYDSKKGVLWVGFSSKGKPYTDYYRWFIEDTKLPNLNEFEKIMEDMIAKIKSSEKF